MSIRIWLRRSAAPLLLLANIVSSPAMALGDGKLCAAFADGKVDQSILSTMLNAAERGNLFRIEASTSKVGFCVDTTLTRVEGTFGDFQGGMVLDQPDSHDGQTLVAIQSASLTTGDQVVGKLIKSGQFFDVENYPEILFVSKGFEWISNTSALMQGDLTMHGVTREVTFTVQLLKEKGRVDDNDVLVKASTTLSRSDFGMDSMPLLISDNVQLCMTVRARRYNATET